MATSEVAVRMIPRRGRRSRAVQTVPASPWLAGAAGPCLAIAACAPARTRAPSPAAWTRAADVAQPEGFMTVHTDASGELYTRGHTPCHPAIDTIMTDVVDGPAGLVAVGDRSAPDAYQATAWVAPVGAGR